MMMPLTELALNMVLPEHKLERMERHKIFAAVLLCLVRMGEPASGFFMSTAVIRLLPSGNGLPVSVYLFVCLSVCRAYICRPSANSASLGLRPQAVPIVSLHCLLCVAHVKLHSPPSPIPLPSLSPPSPLPLPPSPLPLPSFSPPFLLLLSSLSPLSPLPSSLLPL